MDEEAVNMIFLASCHLGLFFSAVALLAGLAVLAVPRNAGGDFLVVMKSRLAVCLISLLLSIASTVVAVTALLCLVAGTNTFWLLLAVLGLGFLLAKRFAPPGFGFRL